MALAFLAILGLLAGVVSADLANSTGKLGPVLGGGSSSSFTGGALSVASSINNDLCFTLGTTDTSASPCLRHDTTQTVDTGMLLTGTVSNHWVIAERQDETFDFAHAQATNPTLFIHSAAQSTTQWLGLTHDGTNGVLSGGVGGLYGYQKAVTVNTGTLAATDSASQFVTTNTGDSDGSTVNLPNDPRIGDVFVIVAVAAQNITVAPAAGETLMFGNTTCGTSFVVGGVATGIGDSATVVAATGGSGAVWMTIASAGTPVCTP